MLHVLHIPEIPTSILTFQKTNEGYNKINKYALLTGWKTLQNCNITPLIKLNIL